MSRSTSAEAKAGKHPPCLPGRQDFTALTPSLWLLWLQCSLNLDVRASENTHLKSSMGSLLLSEGVGVILLMPFYAHKLKIYFKVFLLNSIPNDKDLSKLMWKMENRDIYKSPG